MKSRRAAESRKRCKKNKNEEEDPASLINKAKRRSAEAAWFHATMSLLAFVRPRAEGEQPQARGTITMKRPSAEQHADG